MNVDDSILMSGHLPLAWVVVVGLGYLGILFGCAAAVEGGAISTRVTRHPLVYTLALGVYASAWAFYGSLELAANTGYAYLAYYLGAAGAFLLAPVLLIAIQRISRTYQLASLADLFAFRYRTRWAGLLITLVSCLAVLPLLGIQVKALSDTATILTGRPVGAQLALLLCLVIAAFTVIFGARHSPLHARHDTLLATIALESIVKLVAILVLGAVALWGVFNGPQDIQAWLAGEGLAFQDDADKMPPPQWRTLLLLFFAAALLMPHLFHITFAENLSRATLLQASWTLPLFLLIMALPIPLIGWAAQAQHGGSIAFPAYAAFLMHDSPLVSVTAFVGGLAAASGTMILIALALSGMLVNHIVLIAHPPEARRNLYGWLRWLRRGLIVAVILAGWLFSTGMGERHDLTTLGLASVVGMAQCLPGLLALLYWPGANRSGMLVGLVVGVIIWFAGSWLPLFIEVPLPSLPFGALTAQDAPTWYNMALLSLSTNILLLIGVSLMTGTSEGERFAAEACSVDAVIRSKRMPLEAVDVNDFTVHLARAVGDDVAQREVSRAMKALGIDRDERRPYALRRLRDRIQANLSGLMGPSVARDIVDRYLPFRHAEVPIIDDIQFVESRLEAYRSRLTGLARELDGLRRYHRQTLARLPIGLCVLGDDGELTMWNQSLGNLSGIAGDSVIGAQRDSLPPPWPELLDDALQNAPTPLYKRPVTIDGQEHFLTLQTAELHYESAQGASIVLIEDHSDMKALEDELIHAARLASIGQLAAGVAHEIGNPITGISSLAQNLRYDTDDPDLIQTADQIQTLTQRVARIVDSLVGFAHDGGTLPRTPRDPVCLKTVSDDALHLLHLARSREDVELINTCHQSVVVRGDTQRLTQVMINLLTNARDACDTGGRVEINAGASSRLAWWQVRDTGHGIKDSVRGQLFEPFTTTKPVGEGTGLGLSLAYQIVREHGGSIDVASPPDRDTHGTAITVWLPLYQQDDALLHDPNSAS